MKSIVTILFLVISSLYASAQNNPANEIASKIAQRMKDTLVLTDSQKLKVYDINIRLHEQKNAMRSQYKGNALLNSKIQAVENTRDSLYRTVLTEGQFRQYGQKKRILMNVH